MKTAITTLVVSIALVILANTNASIFAQENNSRLDSIEKRIEAFDDESRLTSRLDLFINMLGVLGIVFGVITALLAWNINNVTREAREELGSIKNIRSESNKLLSELKSEADKTIKVADSTLKSFTKPGIKNESVEKRLDQWNKQKQYFTRLSDIIESTVIVEESKP